MKLKYSKFFKLIEKKDHLIKRLSSLTDEQKQSAIEFFNKHPNYESEIDWNRKDLSWDDFEAVINKPRNTKSQIKKAVKKGIEGLQEGVDYDFLGEGTYKGKPFSVYVPANWKGSRVLASDQVEPKLGTVFDGYTGAKWCISYQKTDQYWKIYTNILEDSDKSDLGAIRRGSMFLFFFGESIPSYKLAIQFSLSNVYDYLMESNSSSKILMDDTKLFNIWTSKDKMVTGTKKYYDFFQKICIPFIEKHKKEILDCAFLKDRKSLMDNFKIQKDLIVKGTKEAVDFLIKTAINHYCEPNSNIMNGELINDVNNYDSLTDFVPAFERNSLKTDSIKFNSDFVLGNLFRFAIDLPEIINLKHRKFRSVLDYVHEFIMDNYEATRTMNYYDISDIILDTLWTYQWEAFLNNLFTKKGSNYELTYDFKHFKGNFNLSSLLYILQDNLHIKITLNSLKGCPEECYEFSVHKIPIASGNLVGGPKKVRHKYAASRCGLTSVEGAPNEVRFLLLDNNEISSIENLKIENKKPLPSALISLEDNKIVNLTLKDLSNIMLIDLSGNPIETISQNILDKESSGDITLRFAEK